MKHKVIEEKELEFVEYHYNSFHPFKRTIGGIKNIEYICITKKSDTTFEGKIKLHCLHNSLEQDFNIYLTQLIEVEEEINDKTEIKIGIVIYNLLIDKLLSQDRHTWIKNDLVKNPTPKLIESVLRCPK